MASCDLRNSALVSVDFAKSNIFRETGQIWFITISHKFILFLFQLVLEIATNKTINVGILRCKN